MPDENYLASRAARDARREDEAVERSDVERKRDKEDRVVDHDDIDESTITGGDGYDALTPESVAMPTLSGFSERIGALERENAALNATQQRWLEGHELKPGEIYVCADTKRRFIPSGSLDLVKLDKRSADRRVVRLASSSWSWRIEDEPYIRYLRVEVPRAASDGGHE